MYLSLAAYVSSHSYSLASGRICSEDALCGGTSGDSGDDKWTGVDGSR